MFEYASDLIYLAARIVPAKSEAEIKEHFRAGLSARLQMKLAEHPERDDLSLDDFIGRADRQDQIEEAKDRVRYQVERRNDDRGRAYAIAGAPRRGGRRPLSSTRRPRKGSEEWQTWCKARDAFATTRKRAAQRSRSFESELLHPSLAEIRPDQSLGLITLRDLPLAMENRRRAFPSRREKTGPE